MFRKVAHWFFVLVVLLSAAASASAEELTGTLSVSVIDYSNGTHEKSYSLQLSANNFLQLELSDPESISSHILQSGAVIKVSGSYISSQLFHVDTISLVNLSPNLSSQTIGTNAVTGVRRPVIILVNIGSNNAFCSSSLVDQIMFTNSDSARAAYETVSRNQLTWNRDTDANGSPDIFGPFTISPSTGSCSNYNGWGMAAYDAAENAGVDFSQYNHRIFVIPRICGFGGVANVGCGETCTAYILDCHEPNVWAHELGHNLGMDHAGDDLNNDGTIESEYGDTSCIMGFTYNQILFNAPHIAQMGWLDAFGSKMIEVSTTGHTNLLSLEADSAVNSNAQIIRVLKSTGVYYYLSYRKNSGVFDELSSEFEGKVSVHTKAGGLTQTAFIDALAEGESFVDSTLGLTVCHNSSNGTSANISVVFNSSHDCDGEDEPVGGSGGAVPGDSDGDGVTDSQETADSTDSSDPGSYMEHLTSPIYALWNSYLGVMNVLELVNPGSTDTTATISLYSITGNHIYSLSYLISAGQQYDVVLNSFPGFLTDSYGIVMITYSGGELDGRSSYYRPSGSQYEFAYSAPFAPVLRGTTGLSFNTYQPSVNSSELNWRVNNWLSIVNLAASSKQFRVKTYNQVGALLADVTHTVPAFGRSDVDGGHELVGPSIIGFHEIIPLDQDEPYIALLTRYGTNAGPSEAETAYTFAFPLSAHAGTGRPIFLPTSRQFGETNWIEVVNTSASATSVTIEWYDSDGSLKLTQFINLDPHAQLHFQADGTILDSGERGHVRITPTVANSIIAQSMLYYRSSSGSIQAMSGVQAKEALGSEYSGSYNLWLNMENYLTISNILNQTVVVRIDSAGSDSSTGTAFVTLAPYETTSIPVHSTAELNTSPDTYGSLLLTPDAIRSLIVDTHRLRYESSNLDFAFPTTVRPQ
ncbi:MAG: hypothetical protein KDD66_02865 [Bdellovibrionales bacterium]|nr:hypothetical protein [Bdellovibrionales bacterium]